MERKYKQYEETLKKYFDKTHISGINYDPIITLTHIQEPNWRNLWSEKAIYELECMDGVGRLGLSFFDFRTKKQGEIILIKKKNKLLVQLMTPSKINNENKRFTLEKSFEVPII